MEEYKSFYEQYKKYETNASEAANNTISHPVSNHICVDLEGIINVLTNLLNFLSGAGNEDTIKSFSETVSSNLKTIQSVQEFLSGDYTNAEKVYCDLKNNLDLLKSMDDKLKEEYNNMPNSKAKKYQKDKKDVNGNILKDAYGNNIKVFDKDKYEKDYGIWDENIRTLKTDCQTIANRIDEYLAYLDNINNFSPSKGRTGVAVPTLGTVPVEFNDFKREITFTSQEMQTVDDIGVETTVFKNENNDGETQVWYAIIPKSMKPQMVISVNDQGKQVKKPTSKIVQESGAILGVNFAVFGSGREFSKGGGDGGLGIIYERGGEHNIYGKHRNQDATFYMDDDGNFHCFYNNPGQVKRRIEKKVDELNLSGKDKETADDIISEIEQYDDCSPDQILENLNPVFAVKSFYPICVNGQNVNYLNTDHNIGGADGGLRHPRTFIGQLKNGDYFVGVCAGKGVASDDVDKNLGMNLNEVYDFVQEVTDGEIDFLMNGDGGGSSGFIYEGDKLNPETEGDERPTPNAIIWGASDSKIVT